MQKADPHRQAAVRRRTGDIPDPHAARLERVRRVMLEKKLDGYLVVDRNDQYWLTSFTGEDGGVLVTHAEVILLTDSRFDETADLETPWARKLLRKKRSPEVTARQIKRCKLARIGFEPAHLTVGTHVALSKAIKPARLVAASGVILDMRLIKSPDEVAAIRRAIRVAEEALLCIRDDLRPGRTETEIAAQLDFEMKRRGASEPSFPTHVAAGAVSSLPHYSPTQNALDRDQPLLTDWGARVDWYMSDLTRVLCAGSLPEPLGSIFGVVREAHDRAIAAVKPGVRASAVDKVARQVIAKAGYDKQFGHALGHGIGLAVHEAPRLGKGCKDKLRAGMVVTVEPGIYLPGVGGIRIEDDVLVTETGYEVLSSLPIDLPLS